MSFLTIAKTVKTPSESVSLYLTSDVVSKFFI